MNGHKIGGWVRISNCVQQDPFGLGYWNNLECILVTFGFDAGKEIEGGVV